MHDITMENLFFCSIKNLYLKCTYYLILIAFFLFRVEIKDPGKVTDEIVELSGTENHHKVNNYIHMIIVYGFISFKNSLLFGRTLANIIQEN